MITTEKNKAIIIEMLEAIEQEGLLAQLDFWAEESVNHGIPGNREMIREILRDIVTTFPDAKLKPIHIMADGDWVTVRCHLTGTHKGVGRHPFVHEGLLAGVAPTGKNFKAQHIHMFRLKDGLVVEHWASRDDIAMARQLGLFPQPQHSPSGEPTRTTEPGAALFNSK